MTTLPAAQWLRRVGVAASLATILAGIWFWQAPSWRPLEEGRGVTYQCAMHAQVVESAPGNCPICGMNLSRVEPEPPVATTYQCAMHAQVVEIAPGNCPICGMHLSKVEAEAELPAGAVSDDGLPQHAPLRLSAGRQQLIGVTTTSVGFRELSRKVRTAATVAYDQELYGLLSEYRATVRAQRASSVSGLEADRALADTRSRSLARTLRRLGVSRAQLDALARAGDDPVSMLLPGQSAWVYARVYAGDLDLPRSGYAVDVTTPEAPGRKFRGHVVTVDATEDPVASGAWIRAIVDTPGGGLRPKMRVHLVMSVPLGRRLAVPLDAVLDTGATQLVFVRREAGYFEPRQVVLGAETDEYREVLSGLSAGEEVVTSANFLIDSESRFRAALASLAAPSKDRGIDTARALESADR